MIAVVLAWLRRKRLLLAIAAALVALYGAFGFWVAPGIAREQIIKQLSAALHRKVTLETVRINPFALSAVLSEFAVEEANGEPITSFDELYVNFSSVSVIRFAWTFSEIRLTRPQVALVIGANGEFNLAALGSGAPEATGERAAGGLPRVVVKQLTVTNGKVSFEDRRAQHAFQTSVDTISFSLQHFSTLPDAQGLQAFSATTDLGQRLAWRGRVGVNPPQSQGHVEVTGIRVPRLAAYLLPGTVTVTQGALGIDADYDVKLLPAGTELSVSSGRIALRDVRVSMGGELTPLNLEFAPVVLHLNGLSGRPGSHAAAALELTPNGAGKVAVRGWFGLDPLAADLNVSATDVALAPFQTLLEPYARLKLERGTLNVDGRFVIDATRPPAMHFGGSAAVSDFSAVDSARGQGFARWRRLDVENLSWNSQPPSFAVARIAADEPYLRFIIGPDRVTNLQNILGAGGPAPAKTGKAQATAPPTHVRVDLVTVRGGSANFADQSLRSKFAIGLQQLSGTVKGLSTQADARAAVALRGKVDRYAPATIRGEINPFAAQAYSDLALRFENIELSSFTPYSGRFAGRRIDKGKLNLDLHYKLVDRELVGENKIVFDQLTLGGHVDSPEALDLPLQLAIAILQDSHGVIDINLPVHGNLDDPQFSYAGIVWKALANLIMKAITAPFALLGSAFGGGEELSYVSFVPGVADIGSGEQVKLDKLGRALADRPQLRLEIRGTASGDGDRAALAQAKLMQQVRGADAALTTPLTDAEQRRLLSLYRQRFGENPPLPAEVPAIERNSRMVEAARARLIEATAVTDDKLRELARNRGFAIADYLVTRANVPKERVFLTDPATTAKTGDDGVRSELKLAVR